ncbi:hypothetical protein OG413_27980 [Streptomyces sp. NBC_01433]|uniref:hypothetical protein n=1 Tax=Streptomyces sp. NBC_01433 TaxID=2903864 RepID=UPI0022562F3D|nr:hypothetical protein [Streptomyces sp. NBC_01433]MCX4679098.1 hypothetical protein [Streptomyces sp. NBC_01433]
MPPARPVPYTGFAQNATKAAWRTNPPWFIVARNDKAITPDVERFATKRAKSHTIEINSSHVVTRPTVTPAQRAAALVAAASGPACGRETDRVLRGVLGA